MVSSLRLQASNPGVGLYWKKDWCSNVDTQRSTLLCRKPPGPALPFCSLTVESRSDAAPPPHYTSAVGSSSLLLSHWNLTQRHVTVLNVFACVTAICATWLFCSAIPALLAFKRAAESLEKLMDATREELPDTMAAIRLSGMEISDLTTELSDLGQEITQGVRSSTRSVRLAEQRLRRFTNMAPSSASLQALTSPKAEPEPEPGGPVVARTARGVREGIVKGRSILQMFFTLTRISRFVFNYITRRR